MINNKDIIKFNLSISFNKKNLYILLKKKIKLYKKFNNMIIKNGNLINILIKNKINPI